jgi:sec-independent protein translocase protein TatC
MMTPTPDAWTMLVLAMPMVGLYFAAVGISLLLDRRRARREPNWANVADDEATPLDDAASRLDVRASPLDDEAGPH